MGQGYDVIPREGGYNQEDGLSPSLTPSTADDKLIALEIKRGEGGRGKGRGCQSAYSFKLNSLQFDADTS